MSIPEKTTGYWRQRGRRCVFPAPALRCAPATDPDETDVASFTHGFWVDHHGSVYFHQKSPTIDPTRQSPDQDPTRQAGE